MGSSINTVTVPYHHTMTTPEVELRAAWHRLAGTGHQSSLDHLLGCHREPHRRYHTATHVMWVLRHIDTIANAELSTDAADVDLAAVRWAALFHDVVYDPTRADNEDRSASLAHRRAVEIGWDTARADAVHRLVMVTKGHAAASLDEGVLVDADLAILGTSPSDYASYVAGVRAEYAHVSAHAWSVGRTAVLDGFLALPQLFHTVTMRQRFEARARANMSAERVSLSGA
jgi:predicted metal-dependent HD superfamily phosphohydrolase